MTLFWLGVAYRTAAELTVAHILLWGNSYHRIEWLRNGAAGELLPLMPWCVTPRKTKGGTKYYEVQLADGYEDLPTSTRPPTATSACTARPPAAAATARASPTWCARGASPSTINSPRCTREEEATVGLATRQEEESAALLAAGSDTPTISEDVLEPTETRLDPRLQPALEKEEQTPGQGSARTLAAHFKRPEASARLTRHRARRAAAVNPTNQGAQRGDFYVNTRELNQVLSSEIYKLRSGKAKPERTKAIVSAAGQIIAAARLELAYCRLVGVKQALPFFGNGNGRVVGNGKALPAPKRK